MGYNYCCSGVVLLDYLLHSLLIGVVRVGVQEADSNDLDTPSLDYADHLSGLLFVQGCFDVTVAAGPLLDIEPVPVRDKARARGGVVHVPNILLRPLSYLRHNPPKALGS